MRLFLLFAALVPTLSLGATNIRLPEASPQSRLSQEVGISKVEIVYHRPGVKGRQVWGSLVPYGEVWRLGANEATTIELSHDASIDGNPIDAGTYALFAIPGEKQWTLVLNRNPKQWGAYFHDPKQDVLRFEVTPRRGEHVEWMRFTTAPAGEGAVEVEMAWEKVRVPFRVEFPVDKLVWRDIDRALAAPEPSTDDYHMAARYALNTGKRLDEALTWADRAMADRSFWSYELKARLLHASGRTAEAIPLMERAIATARGNAPEEYIQGLEAITGAWKSSK